MGYFDEYHIPCKWAYQNMHFRHPELIYGYNDDESLFYAIGYTENRKYQKFDFPYSAFCESVKVEYDKNKEYWAKDIERVEYDFAKPKKNYPYAINIREIYTNLFDYLHSINSYQTGIRQIYGIDCEKQFV